MGIEHYVGSSRSVRNETDPLVGNWIGAAITDSCEQLLQLDHVLAGDEVADHVERRANIIEHESVGTRAPIELVGAKAIYNPVVAAAALNGVADIIGNDNVVTV